MESYRLLELFCGTKSVGSCVEAKFPQFTEIISVDNSKRWKPTHLVDVLTWDYKIYPPNHFDVIWCSPPCTTFSLAKFSNIGRKIKGSDIIRTYQHCIDDIEKFGLPLLKKTLEILEYFKPSVWFIENPRDGKMKDYLDFNFYDCSYCQYGFEYRKNTRIWSNIDLKLDKCNCKGRHSKRLSMEGELDIGGKFSKYVIPSKLIESIFQQALPYLETIEDDQKNE